MSFLITLAVSLLVGDDSSEGAAKREITKLQGTWLVVADVRGDRPYGNISHITFDSNTVVFRWKRDGKDGGNLRFRLDPTKKPKELDLAEEATFKECWKCIYELDGDSLKLCVAGSTNDPRPEFFAGVKNSEQIFYELKRVKPD